MLRILSALQFAPSIDGDELTLQIPAYREDMDSYPDVAEEVIRMYGYEHVIPTFMPTAKVTLGGLNLKQKTELKIKRALCAAGAYEGVHYSFFSPSDLDLLRLPEDAPERKAIKLINPINVDLSLMRTTLASEMLYAISRNQKKGILEGRILSLEMSLFQRHCRSRNTRMRERPSVRAFSERMNLSIHSKVWQRRLRMH